VDVIGSGETGIVDDRHDGDAGVGQWWAPND